MSATYGRSDADASRSLIMDSISRIRSCHGDSSNSFMEAVAMAQARGFPMNVGPCIITPDWDEELMSATFAEAATVAKVIYPPVMALPISMMSGCTSACSQANNLPVRPKPVAISSKIRSTPQLSHSLRSSRRYCG